MPRTLDYSTPDDDPATRGDRFLFTLLSLLWIAFFMAGVVLVAAGVTGLGWAALNRSMPAAAMSAVPTTLGAGALLIAWAIDRHPSQRRPPPRHWTNR